jgi:leucyl aminopeptidase
VIRARNNVTTEIHNTDAEGRLILADCLVAATEEEEEQPALLLDFATLTGAARVALGFELPALFCNNHTELMRMFDLSQSSEVSDPMWPMPLWGAYKSALKSSVADLVNAAEGAGAITAALYLQEFVGKSSPASESSDKEQEKDGEASGTDTSSGSSSGGNGKPLWMHIDFMGTKAGMAEPQGLRSCFEYIKTHVAKRD